MKSVESIKKITASMKLVASSRLKGAQENMEKNSRPFWAAVETIFAGLPLIYYLLASFTISKQLNY